MKVADAVVLRHNLGAPWMGMRGAGFSSSSAATKDTFQIGRNATATAAGGGPLRSGSGKVDELVEAWHIGGVIICLALLTKT